MPSNLRATVLLAAAALLAASCAERHARPAASPADRAQPDPHALCIGNLLTAQPATPAETRLAEFLFGAAPEPPLGLLRPVAACASGDQIVVADVGLRALVSLDPARPRLRTLDVTPQAPVALAADSDGSLLVADGAAATAERLDARGRRRTRYTLDGDPFRPAGIAALRGDVWVANTALQRIEVFDAAGSHLRSVGRRGDQPGEFAMPLALAVTPRDDVLVADLLAARVHIFSPDGAFIRSFGAPTRRFDGLSRPKGVAVGPDGVIFVSDAGTRRVHAFRPDGSPLATFGEPPGSPRSLALPAGVAVTTAPLSAELTPPADFRPDYYVLVAESLLRPGIRVFAWRSSAPHDAADHDALLARHDNPHWRADRCDVCHTNGPATAIPVAAADSLCLACHDGTKAHAEAHPVGWPAQGPRTRAPHDWPLDLGRLACLTCHDIRRHCDAAAVRPVRNPALVRGFDPEDALASCAVCHVADPRRDNPHRSNDACRWCHQPVPDLRDGLRRHQSSLRAEPTQVCLNCHTVHADPAPGGHLGKALSTTQLATLKRRGCEPLLPLYDGRVHCSTCHTPHPPGYFPDDSPLGARAHPADGDHNLRTELVTLCTACHPE